MTHRVKTAWRLLIWPIKLVVAGLICIWLYHNIEWQDFLKSLKSLPPGIVVALIGIAIAGVLVSAWKWQVILRMHRVDYPFIQLTKWYFIGSFISVFLPTNIGGDAYRIYRTYKNPRGRMTSVLSVVIERATGLFALLFLGYLAAFISYRQSGNELSYLVAMVGSVGIVAGVIIMALAIKFNLFRLIARWKAKPAILDNLAAHFQDYRAQLGATGLVFLLSFAFHIVRISGLLLLLSLLEAGVSAYDVFVVTSLTTLLGMLPISIGGFGVIEASFSYLMTFYGLPLSIGLSSILVFRISSLLSTLFGAVFYLVEKESQPGQIIVHPEDKDNFV